MSLAQLREVPPKNLIALVGPPGSGKSTFCLEAVLTSLALNKPVIFVTTEQAPLDVIRSLREMGSGEIRSGILSFANAFHPTPSLSTTGLTDTIDCSCQDLTSIELAITRLQRKTKRKSILLVFDSLTSPYLLNGRKIITFLRLSLLKFAAQGNSVLVCIDEGCGKAEDIGAMMSVANGIIKIKVEEGSRIINVLKHPRVKPTIVKVPIPGALSTPHPMSFDSLNQKLNWIIRRLDYLETVLEESHKYPEVISFLRSVRLGTALYGEPLNTLNRLVAAKRVVESTTTQDEISRIILNAIALKGKLNISQLTREVRHQRGKASRTTVRKRMKELVSGKAVIKEGNYYRLGG